MRDFKSYPAELTEEDGGYTVLFRDLPGAITEGDTYEEALSNAEEVLVGMLESMIDRDVEFKLPSEKEDGEIDIPLPAHLAFPLIVRAYRKEHDLTQTDIAKILGVSQQQAAKLEKPVKGRKLETVAETLDKFGYKIGFYKDEVKAG